MIPICYNRVLGETMNLPDSFPKQFIITLAISMEELMGASMTEWGRILKRVLNNAEATAVEQIRDFRLRNRVLDYYGVDPGENFKMDYRYAWVTTDDGTIQLLRLDMLPLSDRALNVEIGFQEGKYEEVFKDGKWLLREVEIE